jgi:predicted dehydrogenase
MTNGRLRIAIVGLNFGRWICDQLALAPQSALFELAAVVDQDAARAEAEGRARGCAWHQDLAAVLADPTIPCIGLFTGPNGRAELLQRILAAGKQVMTTKPFERDAAAAAAVIREARRLGRVLHCNSPAPAAADLELIRDWRTRHDVGRIVAVHAEIWANYREQPDGSWYDDPERCPLAPVYRLGIYLINDLIALLGRPVAVMAQSSRLFTRRPTADHAQLAIRFADGGLASLFASFCVGDGDDYRNCLVIHGERGTIYRNVGATRATARCRLELVQHREQRRQQTASADLDWLSGDYDWVGFHRACCGGPDPGLDADAVAGALLVIQAMLEAERTHREVLLP